MYLCENLMVICDGCGKESITLIWADGVPPRKNFSCVEYNLLEAGWTIDKDGYNKGPKCSGCNDPTKILVRDHNYTLSEIRALCKNTRRSWEDLLMESV